MSRPSQGQELEVNCETNQRTNCTNLLDLKPNLNTNCLLKREPGKVECTFQTHLMIQFNQVTKPIYI